MQTVIEIQPTLEALFTVINRELSCYEVVVMLNQIHVEPYCFDSRINWDTYIVTVDGYGVYGFTNGPLKETTHD